MRSILAVVLGVALASVVIFVVGAVGHLFYQLPDGLDPADREALKAHMDAVPASAFFFVLFAWTLGAFAGGWLAARISWRLPIAHGLLVGGFLQLAGVINMVVLPHPPWFMVLGVLTFLPPAYAGSLLVRRRRTLPVS